MPGCTMRADNCFAGTRILVEESCHERFIKAFQSVVSGMKVGHGLDRSSEIGPVISGGQSKKVMDYIEIGKEDSKLVMGGYKLNGPEYDKGNFVAPTLFDEVDPNSKVWTGRDFRSSR